MNKMYKLIIIIFFLFCTSNINGMTSEIKNYQIKELSFNESQAEYLVNYPDKGEGNLTVDIFLIIPSQDFSYTISNVGERLEQVSLKAGQNMVTYAGLMRGYQTCNVVLSPVKDRNGNYRSQKIKFQFKKKRGIEFDRNRGLKSDDFVSGLVDNYSSAARKFRLKQRQEKGTDYITFSPGENWYKIYVKEDGIYHLDYYELLKSGINLDGVDPRTIKIYNEGVEIPVLVHGEVDKVFDAYDYLEFYGEKNLYRYNNLYPDRYLDTESDENVYFITWGGEFGRRIVEENGTIVSEDQNEYFQPRFYRNTIHFEKDIFTNNLRYAPGQLNPDHWFYTFADEGVSKEVDFELFNIKNDPVEVKYSLITALSGTEQDQQYQLFLALNSGILPKTSWSGAYPHLDSAAVATNPLVEGNNVFSINNISDNGRVYLNWFEISYSASFKARNNYIKFNQGGRNINNEYYSPKDKLYDFLIHGFNDDDLSIYKLGVSKIVNAVIKSNETASSDVEYSVHFQDYVSGDTEYLIINNNDKLIPEKIEKKFDYTDVEYNNFDNLRDVDNKAQFLIVTNKEFIENEELLEYAAWKEENQFGQNNVRIIDIEQIYDEFSNGEYSGEGLHDFFNYMENNWEQVPEFVMLVGSCGYNHLKSPDNDFVPLVTFQHFRYGSVVSDYKFSTIIDPSGDDRTYFPQFYIGRIPCRTNDQLSNYLKKAAAFQRGENEGLSFQKRLRNLCVLTDEDQYPALKEVIDNEFPMTEFLDRMLLWSEEEPYQGGTATLLDKMDLGIGQLNYFGHGSGQIWANSRLLLPEDVDDLRKNDYLPVIYTWSCFGGNFPSDKAGEFDLGLSDKMLFTDRKGGVAVISASGNSQFSENFQIYQKVLKNQKNKVATLGKLFTKAKYEAYIPHIHMDNNKGMKNLFQYILLGDPSLILNYAKNNPVLETTNPFVTPGDTVQISGFDKLGSGEGIVELYNSDAHRIKREKIFRDSVVDGKLNFIIPDSAACDTVSNSEGYLTARTFWSGDNEEYAVDYLTLFLKNDSVYTEFVKVYTEPAANVLDEKDSIRFCTKAFIGQGLEKLTCFVDTSSSDNFDVSFTSFEHHNSVYSSVTKLKNFPRKSEIRYFFEAEDKEGNISRSDTISFNIPVGDLFHYRYKKPSYADSSGTQLSCTVALWDAYASSNGQNSLIEYDDIKVDYYLSDDEENLTIIGTDTISLNIDELQILDTLVSTIDYDFPPGTHNYTIEINGGDSRQVEYRGAEDPYENNLIKGFLKTNRYSVTVKNGTEIDGVHAVIRDGNISCEIKKEAVSLNSVLQIDTLNIVELIDYEGLTPLLKDEEGNPFGIDLNMYYNGNTLLNDSSLIEFRELELGNIASAVLFRYDKGMKKWQSIGYEEVASKVSKSLHNIKFRTSKLGVFSFFKSDDTNGPNIEISVEGQVFSEGGYVSSNPKFTSIMQDVSGVNTDSIAVLIDDVKVAATEIQVTDLNSVNGSVQISVLKKLTNGDHVIKVISVDNAGNKSSMSKGFTVASDFKILYCGNYPNPFIYETVFCYKITREAKNVELSIFTVSGRKIRKFEKENIINYDEIRWDGRDFDGDMVANGVYFYKLKIKSGSKEYEKFGKIAKIRK